jgi:fructose-1,6-bisphosphatase II
MLTRAPATDTSRLGDRAYRARALVELEPTALAATRAAALACRRWIGRGRPDDADAAATAAMRAALAQAPGRGTVVVGEGAKDDAPMLYDGERLGRGGREFDIAVDPLECTKLCAKGLPGALATIAFAPRGAMARLGCSFYMDKLVAAGSAGRALDLALAPEENLQRAADALDRPAGALRVTVLDKPRHRELVERLHAAGARVISPPDGDVAGALGALLPEGDADLLMGIGGTPEGVMTACAARALGGRMQARLAPQRDDEAAALARAGLDTERIYELDELVGGDSLFVATGVTGGTLLRGPWRRDGQLWTESIVIAAGSVRRIVQAHREEGR